MKIFVTGSTGLVGSALVPFLTTAGHEVIRLVRSEPKGAKGEIFWDPYAETVDKKQLEGADAVVHLAGENIASRWTDKKKEKIRHSRVKTTRFLSKTLGGLENPPEALVCPSAIGYYGDRNEELLKEDSKAGTGFLAEVCQQWETATEPAVKKGIRVVNLRLGLVLSPEGGALGKMLFPFKMGAGGLIGSGQQYWSWIAMDDVVGAIHHAIVTESLKGPVNAVAPNPVSNREFTKTLGRVLSRPTLFPMPAFAARLAFGEMADALLLASARVEPAKLKDSGYEFRQPELENALRHLLGKKGVEV
ncbi:MAG: TIGR01777 family oxidoreductase [bacterium]